MPTFFLDSENGDDNFSGTSFALLASGTDGALAAGSSNVFGILTSASANFPNNNTIAPTKNLAWYSNCLYLNGGLTAAKIGKESIAGPSGIDATVYKLSEAAPLTNNMRFWQATSLYTPWNTGSQYTISVYVKAAEKIKVLLRLASDSKTARYNLSTGVVEATGADPSVSSNIVNAGNGWYRLLLTANTSGSIGSLAADTLEIALLPSSSTALNLAGYEGNDVDGVYICGLQIEAGSSATSYEKPPEQLLNIFNGTNYTPLNITQRIDSTNLRVVIVNGAGLNVSTQTNRQYYIGGRCKTFTTVTNANGIAPAKLIPGDTVRIMGSPAPTIVGSGTWSTLSGRVGAGTSNVVTATNASPIRVTCASTMASLGIGDGDTVLVNLVTSTGGNTNANGVWTVSNVSGSSCDLVGSSGNFNQTASNGILRKMTHRVVTLNSAVTANIASCGNRGTASNPRTVWTAATNVTTSLSTIDVAAGDSKEGDCSDSIAIGAAFVTGKAAYKSTGTLNLSGYQQLSFYIKQTAGTSTVNGDISLRLCSDATGDTTVHTFNIPAIVVNNNWIPFTIDLGSSMSSTINSIALYVDTDRGAQTFLLSNIIACKAPSLPDSLNLQSLISKNTTDELWYPIMSINGTRVMIGQGANLGINTSSTTHRGGYYGVTENVTTYKRESIKTPILNTVSTVNQSFAEGGFVGNYINYEFGWDRTNMSVQNLDTFYDGLNGFGYCFASSNFNYIRINKLGMVRYQRPLRLAGCAFGNHGTIESVGSSEYSFDITGGTSENIFDVLKSSSSSSQGLALFFGCNGNIFNKFIGTNHANNSIFMTQGCGYNRFNYILSAHNNYSIFIDGGSNNTFINGNFIQNAGDAVRYYVADNENYVNCTTTNNGSTYGMYLFNGEIFLKNCTINDSLEFGCYTWGNSRIYSSNHDNTSGNYLITTDAGIIRAQTNVRKTNSGYSWSLAPTSTTFRGSFYPLDFKIATVAVNANALVTIKAWMRRNNDLLNLGLRIKGGQIAGVPNDITSYVTSTLDTWQQVTLTFTPTEVGVVDISAECWGGSSYTGYVDDLTIIQA
jgi:hypothetical protein